MMSVIDLSKVPVTLSMHEAVRKNDFNEVNRLLSLGADLNLRDKNGLTALHLATRSNQDDSHFSIIEIILKNRAEVNAQDNYGNTPLHYAVTRSKAKTIKLLLDFNADFEMKDENGLTPLLMAVFDGYHKMEVLKFLVKNGASLNATNYKGQTPLHHLCLNWSKKNNKVKAAKFLLKKGANIEATDNKNCTPLASLLSHSCCQNLFKFFCKYANFSNVDFDPRIYHSMLSRNSYDGFWNILLKHVAKLLALDLTMHPSFFQEVLRIHVYNEYFNKCKEELILAKSTQLKNSWVTYFNLLVNSKKKLKNYAGNQDSVEDFQKSDCMKKFPIYGPEMQKNMDRAIKRRRFFDDSAVNLSECWPIFNPTHLIIKDILECLTFKNYVSLSQSNKEY